MPRWKPGAAQRLVAAAIELFAEHGYDATTVTQIAERAGVTKSTFFRHFSDKRELLVAGQGTLSRLLAEGVAQAPGDASPLQAVESGLRNAAAAMGPANHELGPKLQAVIAVNAELQQRDALKNVGLAEAMASSLTARGIPAPIATIASELGVLAFKQGCAEWFGQSDPAAGDLIRHVVAALHELHRTAQTLS